MRGLAIIGVAALSLSGCMTAQERMEAQARQDDAYCSHEFKEYYSDCRKALVTVRAMNAQEAAGYNAGSALQNAGAWLQAGAAPAPPMPAAQSMPVAQQTRCDFFRNQMVCR
jgi:hypothetical protein